VSITDIIVGHYRTLATARPLPKFRRNGANTLTNHWTGLGDTVVLTDLAFNTSFRVETLSEHAPALLPNPEGERIGCPVNSDYVIKCFDAGNGHVTQKIRRVFDVPVNDLPAGVVESPGGISHRRVILHFEPGGFADWQHLHVRPQARKLSPPSKLVLESFIEDHPEFEFLEVGRRPSNIAGARHVATPATQDLINLIASAEWFIGIDSGPMHLATALSLNCIVIVDFPEASQIILPTLVDAGLPDMEWLYPQNMHLHQVNAGPLVPRLSAITLDEAFQHDVYPFDQPDWLPLIHEKL
jgi:hypothetical protein